MSFADIENAWRSPHNRPSAVEVEQQKQRFVAQLRRRRRRFLAFISLVIAALAALTARVVWQLVAPAPGAEPIDLTREWSFLLVLALPWAAALLFVIRHRRQRMRSANFERSIADSARALLEENRFARMRTKTAAALHAAFALLLPLVVHQLRAAGKAGDEIIVPAFVVWPLIAAAIGAGMLIHYRRKLRPEKQTLEALLASYQDAGSAAAARD